MNFLCDDISIKIVYLVSVEYRLICSVSKTSARIVEICLDGLTVTFKFFLFEVSRFAAHASEQLFGVEVFVYHMPLHHWKKWPETKPTRAVLSIDERSSKGLPDGSRSRHIRSAFRIGIRLLY